MRLSYIKPCYPWLCRRSPNLFRADRVLPAAWEKTVWSHTPRALITSHQSRDDKRFRVRHHLPTVNIDIDPITVRTPAPIKSFAKRFNPHRSGNRRLQQRQSPVLVKATSLPATSAPPKHQLLPDNKVIGFLITQRLLPAATLRKQIRRHPGRPRRWLGVDMKTSSLEPDLHHRGNGPRRSGNLALGHKSKPSP